MLFVFFHLSNIFAQDDKMSWWREARFGMFIHWGVYAAYGNVYDGYDVNGNYINYDNRGSGMPSEWIMHAAKIPRATYRQKALEFDAKDYNPKEWVRLAKYSGMKYIVITSKHHDGFCLFETKYTDWNAIEASSAGRDLLKDLVNEAKAEGLKIGVYYSQNVDWMAKGGMGNIPELNGAEYSEKEVKEYVETLVIPQIKELTTNYDIDIFWFDLPGASNANKVLSEKILGALIESPVGNKIVYNNRLINGFEGDFLTPETDTPPIPYNGYDSNVDWEACSSINNSWGFQFDDESNPFTMRYSWKNSDYLINRILELSSKGGNFLLNVGPDKHGNIPQKAQNVLTEIGNWMQIYGETVYGTVKNNLINPFEYGYITMKKGNNESVHWYLHVSPTFWTEGEIFLPGVLSSPVEVTLFETKEKLNWRMEDNNLVIVLPDSHPNEIYSSIDVYFSQEPSQISKAALKNDKIRLTPYQAAVNDVLRKDSNPYVIRQFSRGSTIEFNIFLEKGEYSFNSEYSTWLNDAQIYFLVDDTPCGTVTFKTTSTDPMEELNFIKEDFPDAKFILPESKRVNIKVSRNNPAADKTSWVSVKSIGLNKADSSSFEKPRNEVLIQPTFIDQGYFSIYDSVGKTYRIHDLTGKLIREITTNNIRTPVFVSDIQSGIYVVSTDNFQKKIIIKEQSK
jgi:alpha-L-fucosidase